LSRLPENYRAVIVLCDLEGKSRKEVARQLNLREGTVASRLARARTILAKAIARHGLPVSVGALAAVISQEAALARVPASLGLSTIKAVISTAAGRAAAGTISTTAVALTEGVLRTMFLTRLKKVFWLAFVVASLSGAGILASQAPGREGKSARPETDGPIGPPQGLPHHPG
jgi:hypothetical protein